MDKKSIFYDLDSSPKVIALIENQNKERSRLEKLSCTHFLILLFFILGLSSHVYAMQSDDTPVQQEAVQKGVFFPRQGNPIPGREHQSGTKNFVWHRTKLLDESYGNDLPITELIDILNGQMKAMWSNSGGRFGIDTLAIITSTVKATSAELFALGGQKTYNFIPANLLEEAHQEQRDNPSIIWDAKLNIFRSLEENEYVPAGTKLYSLTFFENMFKWEGELSSEVWRFKHDRKKGGAVSGIGSSGFAGASNGYIYFQHEMGHGLGLGHSARYGTPYNATEFLKIGWINEGFRAKTITKSGIYKLVVLNSKAKGGLTLVSQLPKNKDKHYEILLGAAGLNIAAPPKLLSSNIVFVRSAHGNKHLERGNAFVSPQAGVVIRYLDTETDEEGYKYAILDIQFGYETLNNQLPVVNSFTADKTVNADGTYTVGVNEEINITVDAADPDGDQLSYFWTANDKPTFGEGKTVKNGAIAVFGGHSANSPVFKFSSEKQGVFNMVVHIHDGKGGLTKKMLRINVGAGFNVASPFLATGTITDVDGNPVPNATVQVFREISPTDTHTFPGKAITDANGNYSLLLDIPEGNKPLQEELYPIPTHPNYIQDATDPKNVLLRKKLFGIYHAEENGVVSTSSNSFASGGSSTLTITADEGYIVDKIQKRTIDNTGNPLTEYQDQPLQSATPIGDVYIHTFKDLNESIEVKVTFRRPAYGANLLKNANFNQGLAGHWNHNGSTTAHGRRLSVTFGGVASQLVDLTEYFTEQELNTNPAHVSFGTGKGEFQHSVDLEFYDANDVFVGKKQINSGDTEQNAALGSINKTRTHINLPSNVRKIVYKVFGLNSTRKKLFTYIYQTHLSVELGGLQNRLSEVTTDKVISAPVSPVKSFRVAELENILIDGTPVTSNSEVFITDVRLLDNPDNNFIVALANNVPRIITIDNRIYKDMPVGDKVVIPYEYDVATADKSFDAKTFRGVLELVRDEHKFAPTVVTDGLIAQKTKKIPEFIVDIRGGYDQPYPKFTYSTKKYVFEKGKPITPIDVSKFFETDSGAPLTYNVNVYEEAVPLKFTTLGLPAGLSIVDGKIVGTPTEIGFRKLNITATNISGGESLDIYMPMEVYDLTMDFTIDNLEIAESLPHRTAIGRLSSLDVNASRYVYTVENENYDDVIIVTGTKTLRSNDIYDFEERQSIDLRLRATDPETNLFVVKTFTLNITNVDDAPTGITLSNNKVGKGAEVNDVIGEISVASNNAVAYQFVNDRHHAYQHPDFKIVRNNGKVELALARDSQFSSYHLSSVRLSIENADGLNTIVNFIIEYNPGQLSSRKFKAVTNAIYPTLVENIVNVQVEEALYVSIVDGVGNQVYGQTMNEDNKVNVSSLTSGVYIVQIVTNKGIMTQRFIKK